jgi:putative Holliday junction resolvase
MNKHSRPEIAMAFDFGSKETGVAVGQTITRTARGVATLQCKGGKPRWPEVYNLISTYEPSVLIVGLPLHMNGEESDMSALAREFADKLTERFSLPVLMQDERLTTRAADSAIADARETGSAKTEHELAACLIFEDWSAQR